MDGAGGRVRQINANEAEYNDISGTDVQARNTSVPGTKRVCKKGLLYVGETKTRKKAYARKSSVDGKDKYIETVERATTRNCDWGRRTCWKNVVAVTPGEKLLAKKLFLLGGDRGRNN